MPLDKATREAHKPFWEELKALAKQHGYKIDQERTGGSDGKLPFKGEYLATLTVALVKPAPVKRRMFKEVDDR